MTKELCRLFPFGPHAISPCFLLVNGGVVRLKRRVEAVEGSFGVIYLIVNVGGYKALGIGASREFDGLQEVAQDLSEAFEVVVGRFTGDGKQFGRPILEDDGDLLDRVNIVLKHVSKLITAMGRY